MSEAGQDLVQLSLCYLARQCAAALCAEARKRHLLGLARVCIALGVDCNNMCYMFRPSEIAKVSRLFDDSSLKRVRQM